MSVPTVTAPNQARLAAYEEWVAVGTDDSILVYSPDKSWRSVEIPARVDAFWWPPHHLSFGQGHLWIGWDRGEGGGGLYRLDLGVEGSLPPPVLVRKMNVLGIENGLAGEIWVASGISQVGVRRASLLRIEEGEVSDEPVDFRGFNEAPSFGALTLSTDGNPIVVDNYAGILEFRGGKLIELVRGQFAIRHETTWKTRDGAVTPVVAWHGPTDVVTSIDGRYFVAMSGLGVLELSGSRVRQLLFP